MTRVITFKQIMDGAKRKARRGSLGVVYPYSEKKIRELRKAGKEYEFDTARNTLKVIR